MSEKEVFVWVLDRGKGSTFTVHADFRSVVGAGVFTCLDKAGTNAGTGSVQVDVFKTEINFSLPHSSDVLARAKMVKVE